jgi:phage terminase large subunit-like protein
VNIEASTKSGKTVGCMAWIFEQAWVGPDHGNHWWVAPYYTQAKIAYRRMKTGLPPQTFRYNDQELTITLNANKAVIWFKSGEKPDALYGEDVFSAVVDEASRVREDSWFAIRSTLTATRGPIRIIGNVKGKKNWAYKLARRAEAGTPGMSYHRIIANDAVAAGVLDEQEIEDARSILPQAVFDELYRAIPSEDGANPFGITAIRGCCLPSVVEAAPVVWGWDLARKEDWTVGVALDERGRCCHIERFQRSWPETEETIARLSASTLSVIDSTGVGDPVLQNLERKAGSNFEGFLFTAKSKQQLMEGLASAIQAGEVFFPGDPDGQQNSVLQQELEDFEYEHTRNHVLYSAPEGLHDDCVCALALAWHGFRNCHWQPAMIF